ncbi:MAG TPA: ABC transporter ATP-binding protein, partial [Bacteroidia bacterium]|nr:ABC transporter ATP-binding protein [Bacteroidia bacterium]
MNTVIRVENLSKQYRLGKVGVGTLVEDFQRLWHKMRGKEDPTLALAEKNDRSTVGESNFVWALRDINFEVGRGEVLGIIGKNGAGKSTLLKILSRVTEPTTGSIKIKGKVASLLEVGTGFHPDLSGRENIFLNGAVLGMTRAEIKSKFDEIVDFSGVERYIDTPVKRYSSGMKVRLGFAVAAHLEPEILIVDEVLAVGDAEFQRKCLGKMKNVAGHGRTVLFVSHNIFAMRSLCSRALLIDSGTIVSDGGADEVANEYIAATRLIGDDQHAFQWETGGDFSDGRYVRARVETGDELITIDSGIKVRVTVDMKEIDALDPVAVVIHLVNEEDVIVFSTSNLQYNAVLLEAGSNELTCGIPAHLLNSG